MQMRKGAGRAGLSHHMRAERKVILNHLRPVREHGECEAGGNMGVGGGRGKHKWRASRKHNNNKKKPMGRVHLCTWKWIMSLGKYLATFKTTCLKGYEIL